MNFINDHVVADAARVETFFANFLKTDFELDENILSRDEYGKALSGSVYQNVKNRMELNTTLMEDRQLKNVDTTINLHQFTP